MDTSAMVRKAVTDAEKQKHCEQGRCYACSKQGHVARNCPDKESKIKVMKSKAETQGKKEDPSPNYEKLDNGNTLAEYALKLTDDE
jgi:hypothetical protein